MRSLALGFAVLLVPAAATGQSAPTPVPSDRPYSTRIILNGEDVRRILGSPSPSPSASASPRPKPTRKPTPRPATPRPTNTVPPPDVFSEHSN